MKVMLQCNAKAYQSILQNPIAKKQKRISRTVQITSQTCIEKLDAVKNETGSSDSWRFQSRQILSQRKKAYSKKHPKVSPFDIKSVWNPMANVSVTQNYEETLT